MPIKDKKRITIAQQKKRLQKLVNAYVRHRDSFNDMFICISCGNTLPVSKLQAGHYVPVGRSQALRFREENIHGECIACNMFNEFHLIPYRKNLIDKIGIDMVKWLEEHSHDIKKWTKSELDELEQYYTQLLAEAK